MLTISVVVILCVLGTTKAYPGQYIPKAYYVIDREGHQSDLVFLRAKRALDMSAPFRERRNAGGAGGSSFSSASSSSSSGSHSGAGGGGDGIYFGGQDGFPNIAEEVYRNLEQGFKQGSGSGLYPGGNRGFTGGGVSSNSGNPDSNFQHYNNDAGPTLFSRFGEDVGNNVHAKSASSGEKGSFSSSSSSVDGDGKITFSVKSGKY